MQFQMLRRIVVADADCLFRTIYYNYNTVALPRYLGNVTGREIFKLFFDFCNRLVGESFAETDQAVS